LKCSPSSDHPKASRNLRRYAKSLITGAGAQYDPQSDAVPIRPGMKK